jgi:biopolymer transport protein ExbD/biopolymer transport protein TolR
MSFSSSDGDDVLSEINVTPLVDVMLVLLVAFIVTAPVMTNAISVNLPKTVATKPTEQLKPVTLSVDAKGDVYVDKDQVPLSELESKLKTIYQQRPEQVFHLSSDDEVNYGSVAKVMAVVERVGISKLAVLTKVE